MRGGLHRILVGVAAVAVFTPHFPVEAQKALDLEITNGRVSVRADGISIRQILERWAEVGHTTIVNGDELPDTQITLQLDGVSENDALATLLRNVGGYILARRAQMDGAGWVDRIVIIPRQAPPTTVTQVQVPRIGGVTPTPEPSNTAVPPFDLSDRRPTPDIAADVDPTEDPTHEPIEVGGTSRPLPLPPMGRSGQPLGVVSGPDGTNMPVTGALDAEDMSRYKGLPSDPTGVSGAGSVGVGPNPFGINTGADRPGPAPVAPTGPAPAREPVRR